MSRFLLLVCLICLSCAGNKPVQHPPSQKSCGSCRISSAFRSLGHDPQTESDIDPKWKQAREVGPNIVYALGDGHEDMLWCVFVVMTSDDGRTDDLQMIATVFGNGFLKGDAVRVKERVITVETHPYYEAIFCRRPLPVRESSDVVE